jgi:hypothetical protein
VTDRFDPPVPDGIYINWPALAYFRQETRGSSDWIKIRRQRHGWWWSSPYCPRYKAPKKDYLEYGTALHAILLEGVEAYEARFAIEPDKAEFKGLVTTIEEMKQALVDNGYGGWRATWKKEDFAIACAQNIPHVPCWPNILAEFTEAMGVPGLPGSRTALSADEDYELRFMREMATGDFPGNEPLRKLFASDHLPMAEVSVIATIDGIRRRWRFDRMFPRLDMDVKSLGNWTGRPLDYAVGDQLGRYRWAIQRSDYYFARTVMYRMLAERGEAAITGGTPEQRKWLLSWPEEHPVWDWCWLVFQKPSTSGAAPVLFPVWEDSFDPVTGNPSYLRRVGEYQLEQSIIFYREMLEQFGLDRPWGHIEPLHYTEPGPARTHLISLPSWIGEDMPTEENAYI